MAKKQKMAHVAQTLTITVTHETGEFRSFIPGKLESKELAKCLKDLSTYIKLAPDCHVVFQIGGNHNG